MIFQLLMIRDRALNAFQMPVVSVRTVAEGIRIFSDECKRSGSAINSHPSDYDLVLLGTLDDDTGAIVPGAPTVVARAQDFVSSQAS